MTKRKTSGTRQFATKSAGPKRAAERIRETARDLFYRQGIRAVGVDEIVARAGVTKPSLYRSFTSKDALAADYLYTHGQDGLKRFDAAMAEGPGGVRQRFRAWLEALREKATKADYRGCGSTNAAVEYPQRRHPARKVAAETKRQYRERLARVAKEMGATEPEILGDALLLLLEGVYASGQLFGPGGPARVVVEAADALIDGHLSRRANK